MNNLCMLILSYIQCCFLGFWESLKPVYLQFKHFSVLMLLGFFFNSYTSKMNQDIARPWLVFINLAGVDHFLVLSPQLCISLWKFLPPKCLIFSSFSLVCPFKVTGRLVSGFLCLTQLSLLLHLIFLSLFLGMEKVCFLLFDSVYFILSMIFLTLVINLALLNSSCYC